MKTAYEERVDWYNNNIVTKVRKYLQLVNDKEREIAINKVLTDAVVELEQTVDDTYKAKDISNDTKAKIANFSKDIAKSGEIKPRKGEGEDWRVFKKFFSWSESPSDFFDTLLQSVQARGSKILKETTKTSTTSVVPKSDQAAADKVEQEKAAKAAAEKAAKAAAEKAAKAAAEKAAAEKAAKAAAEKAPKLKDRPSSTRPQASKSTVVQADSRAVPNTDVRTDEGWNKAFDAVEAQSRARAVELNKSNTAPISAGLKGKRDKIEIMLAAGSKVYDHVREDRDREKKLGGRQAVIGAKAEQERERLQGATVRPNQTPPTHKDKTQVRG